MATAKLAFLTNSERLELENGTMSIFTRVATKQLKNTRCYSGLRTNIGSGRRFDSRRLAEQIELRKQRQQQQNAMINPISNTNGIIQANDGIMEILSHKTLAIERQVEFMNVFLGFEQANRYAILDTLGNHIGYMEEEDFGITKAVLRQVYRLHRPFSVRVMNRHGEHIMTIRRPFSFINSHIKAILPSTHQENEIVVGETKQQWHLWRRKYNLFLSTAEEEFTQFGAVDSGFLSFMFSVHDEQGNVLGTVDRNWVGLGREFFTDTGVYVLRMDPESFYGMEDIYPNVSGPLSLDERAVLLGTAVSVDFDYFSRHSSGHGGGLFPFGGDWD